MKRGALLMAALLTLAACAPATGLEPQKISDADIQLGTTPPVKAGVATSEPEQQARSEPEESRPMYAGFAAELGATASLVATTIGDTVIYDAPGSGQEMMTLDAHTILGTATVLSVVQQGPDGWLEVMLPIRPNGSTGWVHSTEVALYVVEGRIIIDLSDRQLSYVVSGEEVLTSTVAIGKSGYPTPTGEFFVTDSVTLSSEGTPWGPHALGLSARSDTITEYNGGDGIIGIHGTNNPSSIGNAASLGCVRLPNELITELFGLVPIGTPVEIRA
ncbi:MAG: L,D-transpeptidase [Actinomycetota bacterium]|nr:L,D-transpeptidase [Actinomycetota bacterium]